MARDAAPISPSPFLSGLKSGISRDRHHPAWWRVVHDAGAICTCRRGSSIRRTASGGVKMMDILTAVRWSPYLAGAGIGLMAILSFFLADRPLGCSTAFAKTSGMIERVVRGEQVDTHPYYRKIGPYIDGSWMVVLGIVIGAFVSASLSGTFDLTWVPSRWEEAFGSDPLLRWAAALIGGMLLGFGARWAGGCTSGHGISGTLQLSVNSLIAAICFFIGGIAVAMVLFGFPGV
ncbi:YeeE/YedE thiosulfate transporter family protein [Methanofollis fontis]|uniref:Uncharacterized protein n=1 Tax=Methanofollis fontis TaxID=2052832 RepID=A0A483CLV3_9EURY|nr:YeeE/YedE thiosulfate transporter family protein [Methanofollis fontis]TAJ43867.1 hypothetical protein CUJ86_07320 [Methanofollis fontis]